jgi:hypothetical protein
MALEDILPQVEARMRKAIDALKHELASVRTGRAAPSLVEELEVDAYGAATPLVSLAAISAPRAAPDSHPAVGPQSHQGDREGHPRLGPRPHAG